MGIKPRRLKTNIPKSAKEWLEYQEHRERWTPEMRHTLDQHIRDTFPVTKEDEEIAERFKKRKGVTLHH